MNSIIKCACGCNQTFNKFDSHNRPRKFVSGHNSRLNNPHSKPEVKQICKVCNKIYFHPPSHSNRGKANYCSNKCRSSDAYLWIGGSKNPNWKGGINGVQNLRWCPEYNNWRKGVFKRDNYICQICKNKSTRKNCLHAHHLIPFSINKELRFDINNGITLCKKCHFILHHF